MKLTIRPQKEQTTHGTNQVYSAIFFFFFFFFGGGGGGGGGVGGVLCLIGLFLRYYL